MDIRRYKNNPIITCSDITPSSKDFQVIGVLNPGAAECNGEVVLALRIAERVKQETEDYMRIPLLDENNKLKLLTINKKDADYDFSDSRVIKKVDSNVDFDYLTSMSHIRIARSCDGVNFKIDDVPFIFPENKYESFGIEDPRITKIDHNYYMTYSAVSKYGIVVELAVTNDFKSYKKLGNIFNTENKDAVIFPEKIGEKYFALNRPVSKSTGNPVIWISESDNLINWGNHKILACTRENSWDSAKIGAGVPPIKTDEGWLELYHGVDDMEHYSMGALLLDINCPEKVIGRSKEPILKPEENYEKSGFFSDVIFPCGAVLQEDELYIYYGICDNSIGLAVVKIKDILNTLD
ncbi:glycoside hydrolase family 130 protein [Clostridium sp. AWRP]|uniref:glycoside hydrolase family 130 protein n=1 Tax=Clostridium sp. AWRP TaxID=2212991 RepID=UPI000FDC6D35|nr:glycoside hydrolase family 130 protein [Clostridium sp. AWRP]AZV55595.1 glycosidase [Clostridium sp. AWRP]